MELRHLLRRLQPIAGNAKDDSVMSAELATLDGDSQRAEAHAGRGLAEHAGGLGEQSHQLTDLVLCDCVDCTARFARGRDCEVAVGGIADCERPNDRRRPNRRDAPVVGKRVRHRRATLRLPTEDAGARAVDEAELGELLESLPELGQERAGRDRANDGVGCFPAELLGDLERDRLRSFCVVRA